MHTPHTHTYVYIVYLLYTGQLPHHSLHHEGPPAPHCHYKGMNIKVTFTSLQSLHHGVDSNEGTSPPNPSTGTRKWKIL